MHLDAMKGLVLISLSFSFQSCLCQTVYGPVGGSVVLSCTKNGGHKTSLQWIFKKTTDGKEEQMVRQMSSGTITSGQSELAKRTALYQSGCSLEIKKLQREDEGYFTYTLTDSSIKPSKSIEKTFRLRLFQVNSVPNMPVLESETVTLHCNTLGNDDLLPEISWKPPQGIQLKTQDGPHVSNGGKSLMISSVLKKHRGDWICNLKYEDVVKQFTFKMIVIGLNSSPSKVIYSLLHTPILLPCFIDAGQQTLAMDLLDKSGPTGASWKFSTNDKTIPYYLNVSNNIGNHGQSDSLNKSLAITTSLESRGTYICEVQFQRRTLTASVDLDLVQVVPDTTVPVMEGNELNLTCKVDKVVENLKLVWTHTKKYLNFQTHSFSGTAILKIDKVTNQHIGPWRCSLYVGEKLMTSVEHKLKIVKPPVDVWLILLVCGSIILFAVLITVICCIIKRCQMMSQRRLKQRKYCRCKHPKPKGFQRV
ncbi:CD4-1 molecule isoform X2 [Erpetoichthys calabaricus]|uniref:Lymphocyte activation gene 3 protein-like n=1 Tax=Erpetoichthys calabaricus TaxID=27687 RepID=A0A8C4S961_ERPCA|nr:CD4-1 molecule isoform X2 [Erpetoichthys calabaricus]